MPEFQPFKGLRYDSNRVSLSEVIAPPYDVVSSEDRQELCRKSAYNSIKIELPNRGLPDNVDPYKQAAEEFASWKAEGILVLDKAPSFYIYKMTFDDPVNDRQKSSTTGVIGALALDRTGQTVLPHEQTMPKPKGDRLDLLRASKTNVSPIWALSLTQGLAGICESIAANNPPSGYAGDEDGNLHELWVVDDEEAVDKIKNLVASTPLIIADGHHRYETALHYQAERRESESADQNSQHPYDYLMTFVVELTKEELVIRPIHRLVSGLPEDFDFEHYFSANFQLSPGPSSPIELERNLSERGALGLITKTGNYFLEPTTELIERDSANLDSSKLDVALSHFPAHQLTYQHGATHIYNAVMNDIAQAGILLRPATVEQIAETAHSAKRMPPKTTFFHPKPRTGMVFRSLE